MTTSTAARRRFFQVERHADLLLKTLYEYRDSTPFQLHEFCIMPDHVHLLLTISPGMTIEKALQLIKGGFAFRAGKEFGANGTIWQRGFSEMRIFELEGFHARKHYIRQNAVQTSRHSGGISFLLRLPWVRAGSSPGEPQGLKPTPAWELFRHG